MRPCAILALVLPLTAVSARGAVYLDDWSTAGLELYSNGNFQGGTYTAAVAGGDRILWFRNTYLDGTMEIDTTQNTLSLVSTGLGQATLGWGAQSSGVGSMQNDFTNPINADWSQYRGLRFHVLENSARLLLQVTISSMGAASPAYSGNRELNGGFTGTYDLMFSSMTGGNVFSNVDAVFLNISNNYVGSDFTIGGIELIPVPEPGGTALVLIAGLVAGIRRRRPHRSTLT